MKIKLLIFFLLASFLLAALEINLQSDRSSLNINGNFAEVEKVQIENDKARFSKISLKDCVDSGNYGQAELPVYSRLVALPENGNFKLISADYKFEEQELDANILPVGWQEEKFISDSYYQQDRWLPENIVTIGKPCIMRSHRFAQISVAAVQYNPALKKIRKLKDINLEFEIDHSIRINPLTSAKRSKVFDKLAAGKIIGSEPDEIVLNSPGQYLFIAPDGVVTNLQPLLREKEKLGFKTRLATLAETGNTETQIKNYLQNAYDTWQNPPEYVVLIGDVTGSIQVPAFYVEGYLHPWCVTDHSYTLLDGDDYFPDILIGRISVQTDFELNTVINKIVNYELNPFIDYDWMKRALMVSYVQDGYWQFFSPRETVMECREKLLDFEFTAVDTFIAPWQSGANNLANMINSGQTFVNYRGCGGPGYWAGPNGNMFEVYNIAQLNNGSMLPMITSITCGGGNFAYTGMPSVFGETWLIAGTPSFPKGAIGFIGPSEHDTKTWFNNANDMGIYQGITQEGLFRCGEMLLRGKMELYNNYPNNHAWGNALNSDQFYFFVYNLLGDPGLQVLTDMPLEIDFSFSDSLTTADNFVNAAVTGLVAEPAGFTFAITNDDSLVVCGKTDETGVVNIPASLTAGFYSITASKYGYIPQTEDFEVTTANQVAPVSIVLSDPVSGEQINLAVDVENFNANSAENISLELTTDNDLVSIITGSATIASLASGQVESCSFQIELDPVWQEGMPVELSLEINSSVSNDSFLIDFEVQSPEYNVADFVVDNNSGCLLQNETNVVDIELLNSGSIDAEEMEITISNLTDNCTIVTGTSSYPAIESGATAFNLSPFEINCEEIVSGELAIFKIVVSADGTNLQEFEYTIPIGEISQTSPTFCEYGYYAIESSDIGYFDAPEYDWIEIAPTHGGGGTAIDPVHTTSDGHIAVMDLPFDFAYFGETYDMISICSNGYVSLGEAEILFARNRTIPSGVGTSAMIAPFWDALNMGTVYTQYFPLEHIFVVQWEDMRNCYNYNYETFQLILYDPQYYSGETGDGDIKFQYQEVHNIDQYDNYATVGIENEAQTSGLLLTFANINAPTFTDLQDESAIVFTTKSTYIVDNDNNTLPEVNFQLHQNYPNPFNPTTTISFDLTTEITQNTEISIYNLKGQKVKTLDCHSEFIEGDGNGASNVPHPSTGLRMTKAGYKSYSVVWNGNDDNDKPVSSGVYFYKLSSGEFRKTRKMLLLR